VDFLLKKVALLGRMASNMSKSMDAAAGEAQALRAKTKKGQLFKEKSAPSQPLSPM